MNDHDPGDSPSFAAPEAVEEIHAAPDPLLAILVEAANKFDADIGLTLYVSGTVISGILVSGKRFFELMADWLTAEGAQGLADSLARPIAEMFSTPSTEPGDEEPADLSAVYIHLREARVFASGSDKPLPETLWRGRLSHVSGWSLGTMKASQT